MKDWNNQTALHIGSENGCLGTIIPIKLLLDAGANIDEVDFNNLHRSRWPFRFAQEIRTSLCWTHLLKAGANIRKWRCDETALRVAVESSFESWYDPVEIIRTLPSPQIRGAELDQP